MFFSVKILMTFILNKNKQNKSFELSKKMKTVDWKKIYIRLQIIIINFFFPNLSYKKSKNRIRSFFDNKSNLKYAELQQRSMICKYIIND